MNIYIFGNGNISFEDYQLHYQAPILRMLETHKDATFLVCEFRGTDTLTLELLKSRTAKVKVFHVGSRPRYFPDKFRTKADAWEVIGGFGNDAQRDAAVAELCTHFIANDFNSDEKRKSGTLKNIELCLSLGKMRVEA
jgi:hypothetical protein